MEDFWRAMPAGVVAGVIGGIVGGIGGPLLLVLLLPRKLCPDCGGPLPKLRNCWNTPGVVRRCAACGCGVDARGRRVGANIDARAEEE
jgi:hypothetical protein